MSLKALSVVYRPYTDSGNWPGVDDGLGDGGGGRSRVEIHILLADTREARNYMACYSFYAI